MKKIFTILLLSVIALPSFAQKTIQIDSRQINNIVERLKDSLNIPGISLGIATGNKIQYINSFGYKNIETKMQLTNNSIWPICSISKQFAAAACFNLIEEGKLSLQDKISKYFDNLPESYREITVYNLLSMTSGIKDYINEKGLFGETWDNVEKEIFKDSLNFKPGDAWSYSNTNFWMAAKIVEKITGIKYSEYLKQHFFSKFEMKSTQQFSDTANIESIVKGYAYNDNQFSPPYLDFAKFQGEGDGEILSTLTDLIKWNNSLAHGKIINNVENIEVIPNSGMNYGMGWFVKYIDGNKIVWTPGSGFGFSTSLQYIPDYDLTIIVFCNKEQFLMADEIGFNIFKSIKFALD